MKIIRCQCCGANEFDVINGYQVCKYCRSKYESDIVANKSVSSDISMNSDVQALLKKCKSEPRKARKYANLILDIDPSNIEAQEYLK